MGGLQLLLVFKCIVFK